MGGPSKGLTMLNLKVNNVKICKEYVEDFYISFVTTNLVS